LRYHLHGKRLYVILPPVLAAQKTTSPADAFFGSPGQTMPKDQPVT